MSRRIRLRSVAAYSKTSRDDLSPEQKRILRKLLAEFKELFADLVASVEHASKVHSGEARPSREYVFKPQDVQAIRNKLGKSQAEFSRMIGVSVDTLQNWEQGRQPVGPARALLVVAARAPKVVEKALTRSTRRTG